MGAFVQLYLASLREWRRDSTALLWSMLFPTVLALVVGVVFSSSGKMFFRIGVVNEAGSTAQSFIDGVKDNKAFQITVGSRKDELDALKHGRRDAVLILPQQLPAAANDQQPPAPIPFDIYVDSTSPNGQAAGSLLNQAVTQLGAQVSNSLPRFTAETHNISSKRLTSADYMLPGVLALGMLLLGLYVTAVPLVSLREKTILRQMNTTPLTRFTLLASQFAFRLTIALIQALVIIAISVVVFHLPLQTRQLPETIALVLLGAGTFITLGYVLAGLSKTEESVQVATGLIFLVFAILSGSIIQIWRIPNSIHLLVDAIPLTYLSDALRHSMTGANSVNAMTTDILVLAAWWIVCSILALRFFRWEPMA